MRMFINYAHRGASAYAPENTMAAFELDVRMGANGIELDLQQTRDGTIVLFHDAEIDHKSNGSGTIGEHTYAQLRELDFGGWFHASFQGERIVRFEDFAQTFARRDLTFAVELKGAGFEREALETVRRYFDLNRVYITSFSYEALRRVRALDGAIRLSWLIRESIDEACLKRLQEIRGNQICPAARHAAAADIDLARQWGMGVRLWGISDEETMKRVFPLRTEGMTVNFPDKLKQLMDERDERR